MSENRRSKKKSDRRNDIEQSMIGKTIDWIGEKITDFGGVGRTKRTFRDTQKRLEEQEREAMGEPKKKAKK